MEKGVGSGIDIPFGGGPMEERRDEYVAVGLAVAAEDSSFACCWAHALAGEGEAMRGARGDEDGMCDCRRVDVEVEDGTEGAGEDDVSRLRGLGRGRPE
jgi:hypothetical protein